MANIEKINVNGTEYLIKDTAHSNATTSVDGFMSASDKVALNNKLDKITYEFNKELACGSNGLVCLGKYPCYDSNVTIDLDSTTNTQYHATIILATQNINISGGGSHNIKVYGDATNTVTPIVKYSYNSGSNVISIYADLAGWSKNLIHVRCVALAGTPTDILTSISAIPSDATRTATNALLGIATPSISGEVLVFG